MPLLSWGRFTTTTRPTTTTTTTTTSSSPSSSSHQSSTITPSQPQPFSYLLNLAPELRDQILHCALLIQSPSEYTSICDHVCLGPQETYYLRIGSLRSTPALARVNRKLRQEALSVFFKVNRFSVWLCSHLSRPRPQTKQWLNETMFPFIQRVDIRVDLAGRSAYTAAVLKLDSSAVASLELVDEKYEKGGVCAQRVVEGLNASQGCVRCRQQGQGWSLEKFYAVGRVLLGGGCQGWCRCKRGHCEGH